MSASSEDEGGVDRMRALAERLVARIGGLSATRTLLAVLDAYDGAGGGLTASGLAYTSLIALLPGLLLMVSIFGLVIDDEAVREQLVTAIAEAVPPLEEFARAAFESVSAGAVPTGVIGIIGLIWGSSRFYAALDYAFTRIFQEGRKRNEIERTVRGIIVTFLLVAVPLGALVFGAVTGWLVSRAPDGLSGTLLQLAPPLATFLLFVTGTVLVYRYVPGSPVGWRVLLLPALLVGVILAGFAQLYAFFAPMLTHMAAIYGTFVAFFAILAWLSISFNVLLYGASWTRVREVAAARQGGPSTDADGPPKEPAEAGTPASS
jgi:membrane protein